MKEIFTAKNLEIVNSSSQDFFEQKVQSFPMVSLTEMEYIPDTEDDEPPAYDLNICEKLGQIIVGHLTTKNVVCRLD